MSSELDTSYVETLTHREIEVLTLLADGASNHAIAAALFLEVSTVKWHNTQIYEKLQVRNRRQAVMRAQTLGILKAKTSNLFQQVQHNLPADTLPFIGRVREINELVQQLTREQFRLITILGVGGMGKTRLSIEVGRELIPHFSNGVYFVPLAAITSTEQLVTTLAEIVGFKFHSDTQPKQQLLGHFQSQHILLIFDNFEHLLDSAEFVTEILQKAPKVKVLVTSREKLNLAGERVNVLTGLSAPLEATRTLADYDAVKLFMEGAQRTGVRVQDTEMAIVARICRLVAGMPLAILLAVAWVDTLSITEIEAEIKAGLGILEANLRDAPTRHQSILAAFDVSWKRLSHHEQAVFMRLSVFRDGFTREAAQQVTGASVRDLQRLVHTSFIQLLPSGRYSIHELMRQYGAEKLTASGELDTVREKHALYFAEFITPLGNMAWDKVETKILEYVNADIENVRTAWHFQAGRGNINELRRFLDAIWIFFDQYSRNQEGIELFEPLLALCKNGDNDTNLFRGQLLARLGWFYNDSGRGQEAMVFTEEALDILQTHETSTDILFAYASLAHIYNFADRLKEYQKAVETGYDLCLKLGDSKWQRIFLYSMGGIYYRQGEYQKALEWLQLYPDKPLMGRILTQIGNYEQAENYLLNALNDFPQFHRYSNSRIYCHLIENASLASNYEQAWNYVQRGLQFVNDTTYAWAALDVLGVVLPLLIAENQYEIALEVLSLIMGHRATMERTRTMVAKHQQTLKTVLPIDEFEAAWERGKQLDLGDVITEYMER